MASSCALNRRHRGARPLGRDRYRVHLAERKGDVGDHAVADPQGTREAVVFFGIEQTFRQRLGDHLGQLDGRNRVLQFGLRLDTEHAQDHVRAPVVDGDDGPGGAHPHQVRRHQQHG